MKATNKIRMSLRVLEFDCNPDSITEILKITPDKTWIKGDVINQKSILKYKFNGWELKSDVSENSDFETHLNDIISKVDENLNSFIEICNKYYSEISCAIYLDENDSMPSVHLSKKNIKLLNSLGLEIDFDIYLLPTHSAR